MLKATRSLRASWSRTLRLPKSDFPARPLPSATPEYLRRCTDELYKWQQDSRSKADDNGKIPDTFTLHDGPPYANGPLHIGHALNKITKDVICRFEVSQGKRVNYIPGWDCHGLPIEVKALQAQKKDAASTDPVSVREAARELATRTVEEQKTGFKEWAVMGDWDNAYKTMERGFEIRQLEVFKEMFEKGLIYRQFKPVYWSPSSRTALAEAELEYDENHKSLAAYVRFPVTVAEGLRNGVLNGLQEDLSVVIWTTTPWTLPANKAIAVHNNMDYSIVQDRGNDNELILVASSRIEHYQEALGHDVTIRALKLKGSDLAGNLTYENPFQRANGPQPIIHADFVSDASGTGLVHCAPGHGMDDYNVCSALGIPAFAPVDDAGAFTKEAFPEHPEILEGLPVQNEKKTGSRAIVDYLKKLDLLRGKHTYRHKYPIDWRTKQPVIVRATEQWFANVDGIKHGAMKAIEHVEFKPDAGRARLESFIQGRSQWCISRQRAWGVPIPALYRVDGGRHEATMDSEIIQNAIDVVKSRGIDAWWTDSQDDPAWQPKHLPGTYVRGRDTMDVWFDSGTSWTLLPANDRQPVADVYLEGTDQHRGWFQSSLLTHVATQQYDSQIVKAPYNMLITHGFTLDSDGRKMSKSLGNVISPVQIMSGELLPPIKRKKQKGAKQEQLKSNVPTYDAMGSDALRLWAASSDYTRDVTIGQPVLLSVNQALHKYRVTLKWLLGVISLPSWPQNYYTCLDYSHEDLLTNSLLTDHLAIYRLNQVTNEVHSHYAKYEFFKGVNTLNKYINNDLSAFYFETLKDRIYTGSLAECQHVQTILGLLFYSLLKMLAPVCPLLVEETWAHTPPELRENSIHPARTLWKPSETLSSESRDSNSEPWQDTYLTHIARLSAAIQSAQEELRAAKKLGSSLECRVLLGVPSDIASQSSLISSFLNGSSPSDLTSRTSDLAGLFVVSDLEVRDIEAVEKEIQDLSSRGQEHEWWAQRDCILDNGEEKLTAKVLVVKPKDEKCARCWRYLAPEPDSLCERCEDVVWEQEVRHKL
ncbi:isoleucyl-tRNA synthetase-like protein [Dendryphion nanum]|uniref:Isoleucine--tRNA ligase, mitochondrial n=1 Tax=Dendryphion nanum TaxID=256645 RepID=A0A9P9IFJ7_9PLEO|nr:isoleucyl-tRNA synthetase-like protein [Dendryphion nanum]